MYTTRIISRTPVSVESTKKRESSAVSIDFEIPVRIRSISDKEPFAHLFAIHSDGSHTHSARDSEICLTKVAQTEHEATQFGKAKKKKMKMIDNRKYRRYIRKKNSDRRVRAAQEATLDYVDVSHQTIMGGAHRGELVNGQLVGLLLLAANAADVLHAALLNVLPTMLMLIMTADLQKVDLE